MTLKLYFSLCAIVLFNGLCLVKGSSYDEQCVLDGDIICMNCKTVGICSDNGDGSFNVAFDETCHDGEVCTDLAGPADCYRLTPNVAPECMCEEDECSFDPYDDASYVTCGDDDSREYGTCLAGNVFDVEDCECRRECPACGYYSPNAGNCEEFVSCLTGNDLPGRCPTDYCFNTADCACESIDGCLPCGFREDPSDPEGFYFCENDPESPGRCPNGYHFVADSCSCSNDFTTTVATTTIAPTTTPAPLCGDCGYAPYPGDECTRYYHCNEDGTVAIETCPPLLCYNELECACDFVALRREH